MKLVLLIYLIHVDKNFKNSLHYNFDFLKLHIDISY